MVYPFLYGFVISLYQWNGVGAKVYVGIQNYADLFRDQLFWQALSHNVIIAIVVVSGKIVLGLLLALLLAGKFRGVSVYRTIYFLPMIMSAVAVGLLWSYIYNFNFGIINNGLRALGVRADKLPAWETALRHCSLL